MTDESLRHQLYFAIICYNKLYLDYMLSHAHSKMVTNSLHFVTFVLKFVTELLRKEKSSHITQTRLHSPHARLLHPLYILPDILRCFLAVLGDELHNRTSDDDTIGYG